MKSPLTSTATTFLANVYSAFIMLFAAGLIGLTFPAGGQAQALTGGFFRGAGKADLTFSTTYSSSNEFYLGEKKRDLFPFYDTITRTTLSLYFAYGITDNLDVSVNLPYIITDGDGQGPKDQLPPQHLDNIQDGQLAIKWRPYRTQAGPGRFELVAIGALSVPLSDYENGEAGDPQSMKPILTALGDRTTSVTGELLLQYKFYSGVFTSVQGGYSLKGDTGDNLDVPNAGLISGKLGYAGRHFYGAAWISGQFSNGGTDIGTTPHFPTNQVDYTIFGLTASVPIFDSLSLNARAFTTLDGRNALNRNAISGGITYKFGQ